MKNQLITAWLVLILAVPFLVGGCDTITGYNPSATPALSTEGFAVYLTRDDIPVQEMEKLSYVEISETPVIGMHDIVMYYRDTHDIVLTEQAYERLKQQFDTPKGVNCASFVVCVDKHPVYWGAFWSMLSSFYFDGVMIAVQPLLTSEIHPGAITIRGPHPPDNAPPVEAPRSDIAVMLALHRAGKLSPPLVLYTYPEREKTDSTEGFAMYLTRDDIAAFEMPLISAIDIAAGPVISLDDIVSYARDTHIIELTPEAYERVSRMMVPVWGRSFVVCVDKAPVYWGAFWTPLSSMSFDGVTIMTPAVPMGELPPNSICIDCGYPSSDFWRGDDPRSNPAVMAALEKAGKLK